MQKAMRTRGEARVRIPPPKLIKPTAGDDKVQADMSTTKRRCNKFRSETMAGSALPCRQ